MFRRTGPYQLKITVPSVSGEEPEFYADSFLMETLSSNFTIISPNYIQFDLIYLRAPAELSINQLLNLCLANLPVV